MATKDLGTYEYAGFEYKVTEVEPEGAAKAYVFLSPVEGQHAAAAKDKHMRAALQCFLQEQKDKRR